MSAPIIICLDFLHALLRERGLVSLFLSEDTEIAIGEIKKQFLHTDKAAETLKSLPRGAEGKMTPLLQAIQELPARRETLLAKGESSLSVIEWYAEKIVARAEDLTSTFIAQDPKSNTIITYSLLNLLRWQILLADERESGVQLAAPEWIHDLGKINKLRSFVREQQAYERLFFGLSDEAMRQLYAAAHAAATIDTKLADDVNLRLGGNQSILPLSDTDISATDWFVAFSAKIDILQSVARALVNQSYALFGETIVEGVGGLLLDNDVETHYELIRNLPIFRGLGKAASDSLLRNAHLTRYEKNDLIHSQGEKSSKLYVVLDGWVKLYKTASNGEESILQIAGKKDALIDMNTLAAQGTSPVSIRAITKAWLLSLSGASLRETTVRHREVANALLTTTSVRLQKLVGQYEQVTLRSATERVGWFLLNLNKDFGVEGHPLTLPYDKALIASYLNIKPETFSRVLKDFKSRGFVIERDQVKLPHPKALCDFCDHEIAGRCCHADQENCPRPDLRRPRAELE